MTTDPAATNADAPAAESRLRAALKEAVLAFAAYHTSSVLSDGSYGRLVSAMNEASAALAATSPEEQ